MEILFYWTGFVIWWSCALIMILGLWWIILRWSDHLIRWNTLLYRASRIALYHWLGFERFEETIFTDRKGHKFKMVEVGEEE